jgi:hypothetical protein
MSDSKARAGIFYLKIDGVQRDAKGEFTYNLGRPLREPIIGASSVHGYKTEVQAPRIEGVITDSGNLSVDDILNVTNATITLELQNGKVIILKNAWYAGEGDISTEEGEIEVLFHGLDAEEIR